MWPTASPTRRSATAAWAAWLRASSIRWRRLGLPSFGYGIRYEYGMFAQEIQDGAQVEIPDPWLADGTPWEFPAHRDQLPGELRRLGRAPGTGRQREGVWRPAGEVAAKAYDMVVPGHGTERVSTLRLWKAVAPAHIDLHAFNTGDYARAASSRTSTRTSRGCCIPNDSTPAGRELRLKQEYFFTARRCRTSSRATSTSTAR